LKDLAGCPLPPSPSKINAMSLKTLGTKTNPYWLPPACKYHPPPTKAGGSQFPHL